ncbi:MAG: hypothetical protein IJW22_05070 [Clostridia bacterium]|nr:hypothetical protein [Clostridia bacterium]
MSELLIVQDGRLQLTREGVQAVSLSPIGILVKDGVGYLPISAHCRAEECRVRYAAGEVCLLVQKKEGYWKLTLTALPEGAERFVFGPYQTAGVRYGEILGASWYADGSVACIQSLMPKIDGGLGGAVSTETGVVLTQEKAAAQGDLGITLQCYAQDRSKDCEGLYEGRIPHYRGRARGSVKGLDSPDGKMQGGAIALIAAENADALLDVIERMELAEGLPHPMYEGVYAKRSKRVGSAYMIFSGEALPGEELLSIAERAGLRCVYFSDMLDQWGHFTVNEGAYPGGVDALRALAARATNAGISIGTHNLSNFITTHDAYVTPVPHKDLLIKDETVLVRDIGATDTVIEVRNENNYAEASALNALRIGDELIIYGTYDKERRLLLGCVRGAYGTRAAAHRRCEAVLRLWDHGYKTLFPSAALQGEVADHLADTLLACGVTRTSFDGLEGCEYTGHGSYGPSEFVRRVMARYGDRLICDASITGNYLWHALSYCNWGEPWYDSERRGGNFVMRKNNQEFFKDNLVPAMMGWYKICNAKGKFEATTPEQMESMLSRMAAFDAGIALMQSSSVVRNHGLFAEYLDLIKCWEEFRFEADIPADVLEKLREEYNDWHLERCGDGWKLTQLILHRQDLDYGDQCIATEAGAIYQQGRTDAEGELKHHASIYPVPNPERGVDDLFRFRLRVGHHGHGLMRDLSFENLHFRFTAKGGDYLVFDGGVTLKHYDENFNLLEVVCGGDHPLPEEYLRPVKDMHLIELCYATDLDEVARYELTVITKRAEYHIARKRTK